MLHPEVPGQVRTRGVDAKEELRRHTTDGFTVVGYECNALRGGKPRSRTEDGRMTSRQPNDIPGRSKTGNATKGTEPNALKKKPIRGV